MNVEALSAFVAFAKAHVSSGDIDPMYPVLAYVYRAEYLPNEVALWRTLLFNAWYHVGSAEKTWERFPEPGKLPADWVLPTGVERRGFRGNGGAPAFVNAVLGEAALLGGLGSWVRSSTSLRGPRGWRAARDSFERVKGAGPWSSYKWADLLKNVHEAPITADDIGVGGRGRKAGPIPGMVRLTGEDWERCACDVDLQQTLFQECVSRGVSFTGLDQLETSLCDFNSLCKGRYYVGHDIDEQMGKLGAGPLWWEARKAVFAERFLGEVGGWKGVRKQLRRRFVETGLV